MKISSLIKETLFTIGGLSISYEILENFHFTYASGESMLPTIKSEDLLLIKGRDLFGSKLKIGDIVLA